MNAECHGIILTKSFLPSGALNVIPAKSGTTENASLQFHMRFSKVQTRLGGAQSVNKRLNRGKSFDLHFLCQTANSMVTSSLLSFYPLSIDSLAGCKIVKFQWFCNNSRNRKGNFVMFNVISVASVTNLSQSTVIISSRQNI